MFTKKKWMKAIVLSLVLSLLLTGTAFAAPAASQSPPVMVLSTYLTKEMNYFAKGDARIPADDGTWIKADTQDGSEKNILPFDLPAELISSLGINTDVTITLRDGDVYWVGVGSKGLLRINFNEANPLDCIQYFYGPRYIYNACDDARNVVTGLKSDGNKGVWVLNSEGAVHIKMIPRTLRQKEDIMSGLVSLNDYRGTIIDSNVTAADKGNDLSDGAPAEGVRPATTDSTWAAANDRMFKQESKYSNNNDSFWTGLFLIGEGLKYAALKNSTSPDDIAEAEEARLQVIRSTSNTMLLTKIMGRGDGFMPRNYSSVNEAGGGVSGKITYRIVKTGENTYKGVVQNAGNARSTNLQDFPYDQYFGDGQPIFSMDAGTAKAAGSPGYQKLSPTDKKGQYRQNLQIYLPFVPAGTTVYNRDESGNEIVSTTPASWAYTYDVTENIMDKYPNLVKIFTEPDAVHPDKQGYGGSNWEDITFYTDTSSEEPVGAFLSWFVLYNYLLKDDTDPAHAAQNAELLSLARDCATTTLRGIIDNGYMLKDATGRNTSWGKWYRDYFNKDNDPAAEGDQRDCYGYGDAPLQAAEMMMFVRVTMDLLEGVKDDGTYRSDIKASYQDSYNKFAAEYDKMVNKSLDGDYYNPPFTAQNANDPNTKARNGRGYLQIMQQFVERRLGQMALWIQDEDYLINNANNVNPVANKSLNAFNQSTVVSSTPVKASDASAVETAQRARNMYSQAIAAGNVATSLNRSDEEMYFASYFPLVVLCKNESIYDRVVDGYEQIYNTVMQRDEIPAYTFLMKLAKPDKAGIDEDVKKVVWQLTRVPQYMTGTQTYNNLYRKDYLFSDIGDSESISSNPMWNYTLPLDERKMMKMNDNVRKPDSGNKSDLLKNFKAGSNFNYGSLYLYDPSPYTIPYWMGIYFNIIKEAE